MSSAALGSVSVDIGFLGKYKRRRQKTNGLYVRGSVASSPQTLQFTAVQGQKSKETVRIGVLGASGYTGAEIVRLLANHPHFNITLMTADRKASQSMGSVFPHLITQDLPNMVTIKEADFSDVDAVFCCLPHGTTQEIIKGLPMELKIVDLSADFRLRDIDEYEEWYGQPHTAPELQGEEFVKVLKKQVVPHTQHVCGSNYCFMNVFPDRIPGRAIIVSVIDNLVKGASGQALQNLNLMLGYPENLGLQYQALFP